MVNEGSSELIKLARRMKALEDKHDNLGEQALLELGNLLWKFFIGVSGIIASLGLLLNGLVGILNYLHH